MAPPFQPDLDPIARAYVWVGRIFTICGEMIVPGVLGYEIDHLLGITFPVFAMIGFAAGLILGMTHLVIMANSQETRGRVEHDPAERDEEHRS